MDGEATATPSGKRRVACSASPEAGTSKRPKLVNQVAVTPQEARDTNAANAHGDCEAGTNESPVEGEANGEDDGENDYSSSDEEDDEGPGCSDISENKYYDDEDYDEDCEPAEIEVEENELVVDNALEPCKIKVHLLQGGEDEEFQTWMQTIYASCTYKGKFVGRGFGRHVKRDYIRSTFWTDMEEPCHELSSVAFKLFDRYGRLKEEFKTHPLRKGSGCWGDEFDTGSLFVIESVDVDKTWRRKGIGTSIITSLIKKANTAKRETSFIIVVPGWVNHDIQDDVRGKSDSQRLAIQYSAQEGAETFYRSLGFRRIGASSVLGLAQDPNHKAHKLLPDGDFDLPDGNLEDVKAERPSESIFNDLAEQHATMKNLQTRLPLHHAALTLLDLECVAFFDLFIKEGGDVADFRVGDRSNKNVLHVAAGELKVKTIRWLLENADRDNVLSSGRTLKGYTPVEELEAHLDEKRSTFDYGMMTICISDKFAGYPGEVTECLSILRCLGRACPKDYMLRIKYGCTCGQCIDGYLSPRMKYALLYQAETNYDGLQFEINDGESWCMLHDHIYMAHVAPDIQRNFLTNKSLRYGFAKIFGYVAETLNDNKAPTTANILAAYHTSGEWPPNTKNFLERGGTIESVVTTIFACAKDEDKWSGNGDDQELEDIFEEEMKDLPKCRNDHEYGFVALACGARV